MLHASAAFLEVLLELLELLEDRGGSANHIIQSWDTSTCVIEVFFEVVQLASSREKKRTPGWRALFFSPRMIKKNL